MIGDISAELLLLRRRIATWVLLAIWLALSALFEYLFPYLIYTASARFAPAQALLDQLLPQNLVANLISSFAFYGGTIVLILGALTAGSEFSWGTLKTLFTQRPSRLEVFSSKMLALGIMLVVFVAGAFLLGALWGVLIALREGVAIGWPPLGPLLQAICESWFILAVWAALGVMLAVLTRGTALAIGIGIIYALVLESLIAVFADALSWLKPVGQMLLRTNAYSLIRPLTGASLGPGAGGPGFFNGPFDPTAQAAILLGIYLALFLIIAGLLLQLRDIV
jgi:ABC-2 type transport system permease protein